MYLSFGKADLSLFTTVETTVINYVNTYLNCCGSGQFYSVLLHWLSGKYQPFQFGNGNDFIYSLEFFFFTMLFVFQGWEAPNRRSHLTDWRDQRAGNDQRTSCTSAEELWEFC